MGCSARKIYGCTVSKIDMAWHRTTSTGFVRESVGTNRSCMRLTEPQAQRRLAPKGAPDPKTTHYPTRATVLPDRQQQPVCSRVCWGGGGVPAGVCPFRGWLIPRTGSHTLVWSHSGM
jgi:hypothetical protein